VLLHTIPEIASITNLVLTDVILYRKHSYFVMSVEALYLTSNFILVKVMGNKPVYWFMTWDDPVESIVVCLALFVFGYLLVEMGVLLSEWIAGRNLPNAEQLKSTKVQ
jgi:hypothetical protein